MTLFLKTEYFFLLSETCASIFRAEAESNETERERVGLELNPDNSKQEKWDNQKRDNKDFLYKSKLKINVLINRHVLSSAVNLKYN